MTQTERTHLIPRNVKEQLGVSIETVLTWIRTGELKASNLANNKLRPRWAIAKKDLESFLDKRSNRVASEETEKRPRKYVV